ncbi:MAG: DUF1232 domain-containing protein [Candidatus Eremiobacteraeota bacterium]|nr:DUF1232 domain-containing protein [Candidatus Eremiobacteraeota bacterium]
MDNDFEDPGSSKHVHKLRSRAEKIAGDSKKTGELLALSEEKAEKARGLIDQIYDYLQTLIRLVRAYHSGEYREVPWKVIVAAVFALLYFLNPFDIAPDFLALIGLTDDAIVIGIVSQSINEHLLAFKSWEASRLEEEITALSAKS